MFNPTQGLPLPKDLRLQQGDSLEPVAVAELYDDAGDPWDFTGWTLTGQVRRRASDATSVATVDVTTDTPTVFVAITAALTADLDPATTYQWDCQMTDGTEVYTIAAGQVSVRAEVTR